MWRVKKDEFTDCRIETRDMFGRRIITNMQLDAPILKLPKSGKGKVCAGRRWTRY